MGPLAIALVGAVVGAVLGWLLTWIAGSPDRAQAKLAFNAQQQLLKAQEKLLELQQATSAAQSKIAELETERQQIEFFNRFTPKVAFSFNYPEGNRLTLTASEPFIVESIEYLTGSGAKVGADEINKSSRSIEILIPPSALSKVQILGPWLSTFDRSAPVQLRVHILKDGNRKQFSIDAVLKPEMINSTVVLKLIG